MTNKPEPGSASVPVAKQVKNPVATGLPLTQVAELMANASEQWQECEQISVVLLRALCALTSAQPDQAERGFTAMELHHQMQQERAAWRGDEDSSKVVRTVWKQLESLLTHKVEDLQQLSSDQGLTCVPAVHRDRSTGGSGNYTRYRLVTEPLGPEVSLERLRPLGPDQIRYRCEDIEAVGLFLQLFARGFETTGWKRALYFVVAFMFFLALLLTTLLGVFTLYFQGMFGRAIVSLLSLCLIVLVIWRGWAPLYRPLFTRIGALPSWMQSLDDDRLLELRKPPRHARKAFYVVRYRGTCPLCGGNVLVKQRGLFDSAELAGYCDEAPKAHRFSFDHVLRIGERLKP